MLTQAGILNYSIWNVGDELFGYYECDSVYTALKVQADSDISKRWKTHMKDIMEICKSPDTGEPLVLTNVFKFKCTEN